MTPVRGNTGQLMHVTLDAKKTICGRPCSGWIVGSEDPRKNVSVISCKRCREAVEFN